MKKNKIKYLTLLLVVLTVGCATETISRDMKYANWGFEFLSQERYKDAENYLNQALAVNPENPYALLNLGVVYQNTGRPEKARGLYEKVIKLNPKEIVTRSNQEGATGKTLVDLAKENLQRL